MKNRIFSAQFLLILFLSVPLALALCVMSYSAYKGVQNKNKIKQRTAQMASRNLVDKIDRNFYERFGDVQAFAYNRLAVNAALADTSSPELQSFINTMTQYYVLYDLMIVCDKSGRVIAVNGVDKTGKALHSSFVLGKNMAEESWFKACMAKQGPEGGAWYSDYTVNQDVKALDNDNYIGWGMAFAAPIKDDKGTPIGVWYNFASWYEVTIKIREQAEKELQSVDAGAFVLLTNQADEVVDADDSSLVIGQIKINSASSGELHWKNKTLEMADYERGTALGQGAYTYKGKNWNAFVFIPKESFSFATFLHSDMLGLYGIVVCFLMGAAYLALRFSSRVTNNLDALRNVVDGLSQGELKETHIQFEDEIGEMARSINGLAGSLKKKVQFAEQIGKGNLAVEFEPVGEKDVLGLSLLNMRNSLEQAEDADRKRNWVSEGLAKFAQLLRATGELQNLYDNVLSNLVGYMGANQGSLFVINQDNRNEEVLQVVACYAYNRKKYLNKTIQIGDGLVGQSVLEKDHIFLTEVPEAYVKISSGMGDARPRCVLIMPLMVNEKVVGVVELASFHIFQSHHIEFMKKLAENVASFISSVKVNEETRKLLQDSQMLTETLRAQEEEMRQNMEELQATQEEMERKTREIEQLRIEDKEKYEKEIDAYKDLVRTNMAA
jgi:HAMP domain-containing protein